MKFPAHHSFRTSFFVTARLVVLIALCACSSALHAQIASQPVPPPVQTGPQKLNAEELGRLLAPIALYPDALIALILPASTVPSDVVLGARHLKSNGDPGNTENQPWDGSVKSLARYPDVLAWMDENLEWTAALGEAFVEQPADVMNAVQALRAQAKAAGNLVDTPQQKVVEEDSTIRIVPADPEVIYVPQYDPQVVYVYSSVPVITFGLGLAVGSWLCYDFDWNRRCFYRGNWRGWNHDWSHKSNGNRASVVNIDNANRWLPSANAQRQINQRQANNTGNARYVGERSGAISAQQPAGQGNADTRIAQPGIYNPTSRSPLPRPTKLERSPVGNGRIPAPDRTGNPAINPPSSPAPLPPDTRSIPEASPARPTRTAPSTAPQVPGQITSPGQPRSGTNEPRHPKQPDRFVPEIPVPGNTPKPASPVPASTVNPVRSEPARTIPQNPAASVPTTTRPTPAPVIQQQPRQIQERQQPQPVQEQSSRTRAQTPQPDRPQQRQPRLETVNTPASGQPPASAAQTQVQGRPSPIPSKKKPEEKKTE